MSRIVYVNGDYLPEEEARISVFDRGFLFADGVYEVTSVLDGRSSTSPATSPASTARWPSSRCPPRPTTRPSRRSTASSSPATASTEGMVYLQVTRGAADRDFAYPPEPVPSLVLFTQARPLVDTPRARERHQGHRAPRHPLAAPRHQDGAAPRPVDVQDDGEEGRQGRRLAGRGRLRHRGHLEQRLDRHPRRRDRHPRPLDLDPPRDHPRRRAGARRRGTDPRRGAPLHHRRGPRRRRGLHHRRLRLRDPGRRDRRQAPSATARPVR